jgi:hypothetical protein
MCRVYDGHATYITMLAIKTNIEIKMFLSAKTHNIDYFYKYMSADTAEVVLKNRTLRWSAPSEFNDPFDVPRQLAVDISPQEIMEAIVEFHVNLIKNTPEDISKLDQKIQLIVKVAKESNSPELNNELITGMRKLLKEEGPTSNSLDEFKNHWPKTLTEMRILCLCESHEKTSMWYHYADKYRGATIQFSCNDNADSPWRIAKPIVYTNDEPLASTAEGWAKLLTMQTELAMAELFDVCMHTKSEDWGYEKEWRMASFRRPQDTGPYTDYKFDAKSVGNLYLGPLISDNDKNKLLEAAKAYSNMQIFDSYIGASRKLKFVPIKG